MLGEVRCAYSESVEHLIRSQFAIEIGTAREMSAEIAVTRGGHDCL